MFVQNTPIFFKSVRATCRTSILLRKLGTIQTPVLLKRGFSATYDELLNAAEYILAGGNPNVMLCERGIRTFETYTRNTFDLSAIPVLHLAICRLSPIRAMVQDAVSW